MALAQPYTAQVALTGRLNFYSTNTSNRRNNRASTSSRPRVHWNPRQLLDLHPDEVGFTCSGTTKRGLRCRQSFISGADLREASAILDDMERKKYAREICLDTLEDLAYLTLCPRWHRKPGYSQVKALAAQWERKIKLYLTSADATSTSTPATDRTGARVVRVNGRRRLVLHQSPPNRESSSEESSDLDNESENDSGYVSTSDASEDSGNESHEEFEIEVVVTRGRHESTTLSHSAQNSSRTAAPVHRDASSSTTQPSADRSSMAELPAEATPPETTNRQPVSHTSPTATNTRANITPAPTPPIPSSIASSSTTTTPFATTPTPYNSTNTSPILTPVSTPSTAPTPVDAPPILTPNSTAPDIPIEPIVGPTSSLPLSSPATPRRKPLTEPCCICLLPFSPSDSSDTPELDNDAVYCRAQCGTNLHRVCFNEWRKQCFRNYEEDLNPGSRALTPAEKWEQLESVTCVFCRGRWRWEWEE